MPRSIDGVARVVAIASGKGGVGKTTVAVNLALALSLQGARVGLFDADIYGPNVPLMLGVRQIHSPRLMMPVARAERMPYLKPLERYGLKVMSMGLLVGDADAVMPNPRFSGMLVTQTLQDVVWGELDYLVIDLPPGTGEPQQSLLRAVKVDGVVVVTTPQDLSLLDAGRSLGQFQQAQVPLLGMIENMSYFRCPHCGERIHVFHQSDGRLPVRAQAAEILGRIPMDIGISRGIDAGHPLVQATPDAVETALFREIAGQITRKLDAL